MKISRIGIVGSGRIGGNLGILLARAGYEIFYSSRHPDTLKELVKKSGPKARAGTIMEAIAFWRCGRTFDSLEGVTGV